MEIWAEHSGLLCDGASIISLGKDGVNCYIAKNLDNELIYMKVGDEEIPCTNQDSENCHLSIVDQVRSNGSFEAPESITDDEEVCIHIHIGGQGWKNYKVKVNGVDIKNAYFANNCMNFFVDIPLVPGDYEITITEQINRCSGDVD